MDLKGSLVDTKLKIIPSKKLLQFLNNINTEKNIPTNIIKITGRDNNENSESKEVNNKPSIDLTSGDVATLNDITNKFLKQQINLNSKNDANKKSKRRKEIADGKENTEANENLKKEYFLETTDLEWLYSYLQNERCEKKDTPYLHIILEGSEIVVPENQIIKRNPDLEARCVKLRSQQEAREYRKMTKTVDNVRMRFPEDSISYQLKHLNRQLIAIGQFIISIFAGFLFGFRGIEWMVGNLDFGFRLLLGVMCALVIALAEIYFLAKKLNEEDVITDSEPIQLGGPHKFTNEGNTSAPEASGNMKSKEHED